MSCSPVATAVVTFLIVFLSIILLLSCPGILTRFFYPIIISFNSQLVVVRWFVCARIGLFQMVWRLFLRVF